MSAAEVYRDLVAFARANGFEREERGSGWWWRPDESDLATIGEVADILFDQAQIDTREEPLLPAVDDPLLALATRPLTADLCECEALCECDREE